MQPGSWSQHEAGCPSVTPCGEICTIKNNIS